MSEPSPVVCITGAAGQLAAAVVRHFAARGARLVLLDRSTDRLRQHYPDLANAVLVQADLLDREQVAQALAQVGRIDVLCHLAGGFRMGEAVHATNAQTWDFLMDLNARSLLHLAAAVVPQMQARGSGRIVTVGAAGALKGAAQMGAYGASKSALMRLTEAMSAELRDAGINVNCVLPSTLDTPANRAAMPDADASRWVALDALADVIGFLASDAARAIHGALIPVLGRV